MMDPTKSLTLIACFVQIFCSAVEIQAQTVDPTKLQNSFNSVFDQLKVVMKDFIEDNEKKHKANRAAIEDLKERIVAQNEQIAFLKELVERLKENGTAPSANGTSGGENGQRKGGSATDTGVRTHGGVTFIRWGRTVCPETTKAIYTGYAAGNIYNKYGGGANYLCLPKNPQWDSDSLENNTEASKIYGVEYQLRINDSPFLLDNNDDQELVQFDAPCVLCDSLQRSTVMTLPARTECPPGWNLEYHGYLVTEGDYEHNKEYVCLDKAPERVKERGPINDNEALFYAVEIACGTLPCSVYRSGRELACVVCTR